MLFVVLHCLKKATIYILVLRDNNNKNKLMVSNLPLIQLKVISDGIS